MLLSYFIAKDSDARRQYLTVKSLSTESAKSSASSRGSDTSPGHKSFGGSYSTRGGGKKNGLALTIRNKVSNSKHKRSICEVIMVQNIELNGC